MKRKWTWEDGGADEAGKMEAWGNGLERRPADLACQGLLKGDMCLLFMETSRVGVIGS